MVPNFDEASISSAGIGLAFGQQTTSYNYGVISPTYSWNCSPKCVIINHPTIYCVKKL
jgi:hypothetical protein